jgi:catechol 1,2-dioxygenase
MAHLHAFIDEVQLTPEEWLLACNGLAKAGQVSDETRNEFILISDVLGIESLVDTLAQKRVREKIKTKETSASKEPTSSAVLGPFFRENAPVLDMGSDIVKDHSTTDENGKKGESTYVFGTIKDMNGNPIEGAVIDVWHDAINGLYEQQDPIQPDYNCRGQFTTGKDGKYSFQCLKPVAYPIPYDSTTGDILSALDRSCMRPGHIHLFIRTKGYQSLVTQVRRGRKAGKHIESLYVLTRHTLYSPRSLIVNVLISVGMQYSPSRMTSWLNSFQPKVPIR